MQPETKITNISDKALQEFKALYKENFNEDISDDFARKDALRLLNLIHIMYEIELNTTDEQREKIKEIQEVSKELNIVLSACLTLEQEGRYEVAQEIFTKIVAIRYPLSTEKESVTKTIIKYYNPDRNKRISLTIDEYQENLRGLLQETESILHEQMVPESEPIPRDANLLEILLNREGLFTEEQKADYDRRKLPPPDELISYLKNLRR